MTRPEEAWIRVADELDAVTRQHAQMLHAATAAAARRAVGPAHVAHIADQRRLEQRRAQRHVVGLEARVDAAHKEHIAHARQVEVVVAVAVAIAIGAIGVAVGVAVCIVQELRQVVDDDGRRDEATRA